MKNGVAYITLSDGKMHFLLRQDRNSDLLMLSSVAESDAEALAMAIRYALDNNAMLKRAVVAIDGRKCILRNFQLPIKNRRQIEHVVEFELDEDLPFERHELVSDCFRGRYAEGISYISVASIKKEPVADILELFQEQGIEIEKIDVDVAAFARACASRFSSYERCVGLEVGKDRTLFCHLVDGLVQSLAIIPWGESFLVNSFAAKNGLSVDEVDRVMVFSGESLGEKSGGNLQDAFQKQLKSFVSKQLREVYRLLGNSEWPSRFILSGDIVRVQTFREAFEEISEGHLDVWDELYLKLGDEVDEGQRGSGLATSFGVAEESGEAFNFRKDEFALVGMNSIWNQEGVFFVTLLLSIVFAWGAYAYVNLISNDRELAYLKKATLQVYKDALPEVSQSLAPMQYQSIISSRVDMFSGRLVNQSGKKNVSVIETLRGVSAILDKKIDVEFISLNLDSKRIDLQGETRSMNAVAGIHKAIEKMKIFQKVKIKNATVNKKSKKIRFEIEVQR